MAPEQAVGDPSTDHRADIYSFGCLAYELFAGKPPFHSFPRISVIAAHIATTPTPVAGLCAGVPRPVAQLIARCLEKKPDDRPQSARELLSALEGAATAGVSTPLLSGATTRARRALLWAGCWRWPRSDWHRGVCRHPRQGSFALITIAVLPFANTAADSRSTSSLADSPKRSRRRSARVPGIQIQSRSGARAYCEHANGGRGRGRGEAQG